MSPRLRTSAAILVSTAIPLAAYVATLRGSVGFWDTGDLQTVPYILGIPYPTGFPGFVLIGWVWSHVVVLGSVAWRINLLAAVATATSAGALCALLVALDVMPTVAVGGALAFACASVVWERATYVDAHRIGFAAAAVALVFAARWLGGGKWRDAQATGLAAAAALAIDNTTILVIPALAAVALGRPPPLRRTLALCGACALLVAAAYAYLPIRSAVVTAARTDPTLAIGLPPGRPFWDDHHPASLAGFVRLVAGTEFAPEQAATSMFSLHALQGIGSDLWPHLDDAFGALGIALAAFGLLVLSWRLPMVTIGLLLFAVAPTVFAVSYAAESDTARYFTPAYFVVAATAAYGVSSLLAALEPPLGPALATVLAFALVLTVRSDVAATRASFGGPEDRSAAELIGRVIAVTPSNAIVVAPWLYATPLAYGAYVEKRLGKRIVVTSWPGDVKSYYPRWVRTRPVAIVGDVERRDVGLPFRTIDQGDPPIALLTGRKP